MIDGTCGARVVCPLLTRIRRRSPVVLDRHDAQGEPQLLLLLHDHQCDLAFSPCGDALGALKEE